MRVRLEKWVKKGKGFKPVVIKQSPGAHPTGFRAPRGLAPAASRSGLVAGLQGAAGTRLRPTSGLRA